MSRRVVWFALGLLLAVGVLAGGSYAGWLMFGKPQEEVVELPQSAPVPQPADPPQQPPTQPPVPTPKELVPLPKSKKQRLLPPNEKPDPEKPFVPVPAFEKSVTGEPGIAVPKADAAEVKPLPPAAVPTLTPAQRLGDRVHRGPHVLYPLAISADAKVAAFTSGFEVCNERWHWQGQEMVVWDVEGKREIGRIGEKPAQINFSPDGNTLYAGGSRDNFRASQLRIWDVPSRKLLYERPVSQFALSADGKTLATLDIHVGTFDLMGSDEDVAPWRCTVAIWNTADFTQRAAYTYTSFIPTAIGLSPDGSKVALAARDIVIVADAATGKRLWNAKLEPDPLDGHGLIFSLVFSPDSKTLASAEHCYFPTRHLVRVWDVATGKGRLLSPDDKVSGGLPPLVGMAFTPDSKTLFVSFQGAVSPVAVADGVIPRIIHHEDKEKRNEFFARGLNPPNMDSLYTFALTADGKTALLGGRFKGDTCGLRIMDVAAREVKFPPKITAIKPPHPPADEFLGPNVPFHPVAADWLKLPDGRELQWRSYISTLSIGGKPIGEGEMLNYVVTPDGETIITRGRGERLANGNYKDDPQMRFRDADGKAWGEAVGPEWAQAWARRAMTLSADGRTLAALNPDGAIWLWEVATAKPRARLDRAGTEDLYRFAFSRDGRYVMSNDFHAQNGLVWDLRKLVEDKKEAPDEKELAALWEALRGDDASAAYKAILQFASHPAQSVPFLKGKAKDVLVVTDKAKLAARPFDKDIVLARRFVEALENAGTPEALALLKEIVTPSAFAEPAGAALKRLESK